jgi:hypothetical protein
MGVYSSILLDPKLNEMEFQDNSLYYFHVIKTAKDN